MLRLVVKDKEIIKVILISILWSLWYLSWEKLEDAIFFGLQVIQAQI